MFGRCSLYILKKIEQRGMIYGIFTMDTMETFCRFSRPVFRVDLVPVFINTLRALSLPDWVMVRERLYTEHADVLIETMIRYKDTFVAREVCEKQWYSLIKTYPWDESTQQLHQTMLETRKREQEAYQILCELLKNPAYEYHEEDWTLTLQWLRQTTVL